MSVFNLPLEPKQQRLVDLLDQGITPIVRISKDTEFIDLEEGSMAKVVEYKKDYEDDSEYVLELTLDFSEFEEYNKNFQKFVFHSDKGLVKYSDSPIYPKSKRTTIFVGYGSDQYFELLDSSHKNELFDRYQKDVNKGSQTYVNWLEEELKKAKKRCC